MKSYKLLISVMVLVLFCTACGQAPKESTTEQTEAVALDGNLIVTSAYLGNYVTESYFEKESGLDWVAVSVKQAEGDDLFIFVNSRDDIKKPTCTFEAIAQKQSDSVYVATVDDKNILFTFTETAVKISTERVEDVGILSFYCSGGATLAGSYTKVNE